MEIKTGYDAVMYLGRKLYGQKFSLPPERLAKYKRIYELLMEKDDVGKGLLIIGPKGVGKSTCMRIMQKMFIDTRREFKSVDALRLKDLLDEYTLSEIKAMYGGDLKKDLYLDDIGIGPSEVKDYGNVINVVGEILWERDELFIKDGFRTHISSNLLTSLPATAPAAADKKPFTLETIYGDRIYDRIKNICHLIEWPGDSLRGKK